MERRLHDFIPLANNPVVIIEDYRADALCRMTNCSEGAIRCIESSCLTGGCAQDEKQYIREHLSDLHSRWMVQAGAKLKGEGACEVSGRVSYGGEALSVVEGKSFQLPVYVATAEETCTVEECETVC